jgi:hypothetical protein
MADKKHERFEKLTFDDFRQMATDASLSRYEKIGFPDSYREGKEAFIFQEIVQKLPLLTGQDKRVLDVGPGCSEIPSMLIKLCRENRHTLIAIDSEEMLSHLPDEPFIKKVSGSFPACADSLVDQQGKIDVILAYSVLHYVFADGNVWEFLDRSLELLAINGEMLIGDIPNVSKRKRFFSSPTGIKFHQEFTESSEIPQVDFYGVEHHRIDDSVVMSLMMRARSAGFDAYVVPQGRKLPMANRREDIFIKRP